MARKREIVTVAEKGRDEGKSFLLVEMPPRKGEKWATRALLALGRAGGAEMDPALKEELQGAGMAGIAAVGVRALAALDFHDAEPLLDEMMECVSFVPDRTKIDQMTQEPISRGLIEDDIEEISTLLFLRSKIVELHVGFSIAAFLSRLGAAAKARWTSQNIPTSPESSDAS